MFTWYWLWKLSDIHGKKVSACNMMSWKLFSSCSTNCWKHATVSEYSISYHKNSVTYTINIVTYGSVFLTLLSSLPTPSLGWKIRNLHGADLKPNKIDYWSWHVSRSLHMRGHLNQTISHVMFVYLSSVHDVIIYPTDICTCSTSGYMISLRRNKITAAMHKNW